MQFFTNKKHPLLVTAISNTYALTWPPFYTNLPPHHLTKRVIAVHFDGLHSRDLQSIGTYQPNWYAHVLWGLYKICNNFFKHCLSKADLLEGSTCQPSHNVQHQSCQIHDLYLVSMPCHPAVHTATYINYNTNCHTAQHYQWWGQTTLQAQRTRGAEGLTKKFISNQTLMGTLGILLA